MVPESVESDIASVEPRRGGKLWLQILLVVMLALLAQAIGLAFAYVSRCKPGQGNEWCGLGSVAGVLGGFVAAVCVFVAGSIIIALKRRNGRGGNDKVGTLRVLLIVLGVLLVLPCAYELGFGWVRTHKDAGLWLGLMLGVGLIGVASMSRRRG